MKIFWFDTKDFSYRLAIVARSKKEAEEILVAHESENFEDPLGAHSLAGEIEISTLTTSGVIADLTDGYSVYEKSPVDPRG